MDSQNQFAAELEVFERHRREWSRSHAGEFVVIQGNEIAPGFFAEYGDALRAGLQRFGAAREFLVKQIWVTEPVYLV